MMILIKSDIESDGTRLFAIETGLVYDLYPDGGRRCLIIWDFRQPKYPYQMKYRGIAAEDIWVRLTVENEVYDCEEWK
jgi:hypothetical protein